MQGYVVLKVPVPRHAKDHWKEWKPTAPGHIRLRLSFDWILLQYRPTTGNHRWQIALIKSKREPVSLGEVVRGEVNDQRHMPQPFSCEGHGEFRLHTWQG